MNGGPPLSNPIVIGSFQASLRNGSKYVNEVPAGVVYGTRGVTNVGAVFGA